MASVFNLSRVFRFKMAGDIPQISAFPEDPPEAPTDLQVRMKHFTEIENFTFLGYVLAHECDGPAKPISTLLNVEVPDKEFQAMVEKAQTEPVTDEELGDTLLDVGINWEHFVASTNSMMVAGDPLHISDTRLQEKIDSLDIIAEALVREINIRSIAHGKHK